MLAVGLLAAFATISCGRGAIADDCLTSPNDQIGPGGHWYYHVDRANNRKCWYVRAAQAEAPRAVSAEAATSPGLVSSWFSWLTGSPPPQTDTQPDPARRLIQAAPTNPLTIDDIVRKQGPRVARNADSNGVLEPDLRQRPQALSSAEHGSSRNSAELARRDALFREYLRWQEQHPRTP